MYRATVQVRPKQTLKRVFSGFTAAVLVATSLTGLALAATESSNTFETTVGDWTNVTRVAATPGMPASEGNYYAQADIEPNAGAPNGAFTRWGGYESTFPAGGYTTSVDVYLDMALATGGADKRFDFSSAINNTAGTHRRDFVFTAGTNPSANGQWLVNVGNNTPGNPVNGVRVPAAINATGWYTLQANFQNNTGVLAVTMSVISRNTDAIMGSWTLSDASDIIGTTVGGHRYGWFVPQQPVANRIGTVLIDRANLRLNYPVPNAPTNLAPASGTVTNDTSVTQSWDAMPNATYYEYRTSNSQVDSTTLGPIIYTDNSNSSNYSISGGRVLRGNSGTPEGDYYWQVRAANVFGVFSDWSAISKLTVDTTAPTQVTAISPINNVNQSNLTATFSWTASTDAHPGFTYELLVANNGALDGSGKLANGVSAGTSTTTSKTATLAADGTYYWQVQATDAAGNKSLWSTPASFTIDTTGPTTPVQTAPANTSFSTDNDVTFNWKKATDANSNTVTYELRYSTDAGQLNSATPVTGITATKKKINNLADATYYWQVRAVDTLGNAGGWSSVRSVTVDTTDPTAVVTPGFLLTNGNSLSIDGTADDANFVSYSYALIDSNNNVVNGTRQTVTTPVVNGNLGSWDLTGLASDFYAVELTVTDAAGRMTTTYGYVAVDHGRPTVAITNPSAGEFMDDTFIVRGTASDDFSGIDRVVVRIFDANGNQVDRGDAVYNSNNGRFRYNVAGLADGNYTVRARAIDFAGNARQTAPVNFTVDTTAPTVTVNPLTTTDTTPTLTGTVNDSAAAVVVNVNGTNYNATVNGNSWTVTTNPLAIGTYNVVATATDAAGNSATDSTTNELVIQQMTAPVVSNAGSSSASASTTGASSSAGGNTSSSASTSGSSANSGQVLGTASESDTSSASTKKGKKTISNASGDFLGLGWWWLPIIAASAVIFFTIGRRINSNTTN